jgi:hypothetical protein
MFRVLVIIFSISLVGCASLPENYSLLTSEQFIKGVANNNKPKIMPAKYVNESFDGITMIATSYNIVGSYGSGTILNVIQESKKLCQDKGLKLLGEQVINHRNLLACGNDKLSFLAIHFVSTEDAGRDTGQTFAYYDHIALFDLTKIDKANLAWVSHQYLLFESGSIDFEYAYDFPKLNELELTERLTSYIN